MTWESFRELFDMLGGGTSALIIIALVWDRLRITKKQDALTDLLMARKDDDLRASVEREIATRQSLEQIIQFVSSNKV